jgi:hypothetical protein
MAFDSHSHEFSQPDESAKSARHILANEAITLASFSPPNFGLKDEFLKPAADSGTLLPPDLFNNLRKQLPPDVREPVLRGGWNAMADALNEINKSRPENQRQPELKPTGNLNQDLLNSQKMADALNLSQEEKERALAAFYNGMTNVLQDYNHHRIPI